MSQSPIGRPYLVTEDTAGRPSAAKPLDALPLDSAIDEAWVQELLAAHPDLLPVGAIDERVEEPLVSLGREIATSTGPIDNLFISRNGYLVVVETKLWRNPEARRKVVSQIVDYATHLRRWDYSAVESAWRKHGGVGESLWEYVKPTDSDEEADWVDKVNANLAAGRMALLIVGDGIRSQAGQLAAALDGHPGFQYRLGLVELRLHRVDDGRVLVVPTTLAVTHEITRAVVTVQWTEGMAPSVQIETPAMEPQRREGSALTEVAFLDELRTNGDSGEQKAAVAGRLLERLRDAGYSLKWTRSGVSVRFQDPHTGSIMFSLLRLERSGVFNCNLVWLRAHLRDASYPDEAAERVVNTHIQLVKRFGARQINKVKLAADLTKLAGREDELVEGLQNTAVLLQTEAEKLPPVEESEG